ncbi:MAG: replication initiation factor domain-containing protein [Methylobacter sp.]
MAKKPNFNTLVPYAQSVIDQKILVASIDAQKHNKRVEYFKKFIQAVATADDEDRGGRGGEGLRKAPPYTNRGGKSRDISHTASFQSLEKLDFISLGQSGKFKVVATPKPNLSADITHSFIDWVNFTFKTSSLPLKFKNGHSATTDLDYVHSLSALLFKVFGFGVIGQRASGMNFYEKSFDLGTNGWGLVCIGGQNGSCSVTVKGQGLMSSKPGWEQRLHDLLVSIPHSVLTRVDLASDNFNSKLSVDDYLEMYKANMFTSRGRSPNVEQAGNWVKPNGKGRTLYVGSRKSGKLLRIYEKGLQLANGFHEKYPNWLRVELELKNQDRDIPYDVLLRPGQFLAGAYPALVDIHKIQDVIKTAKKTAVSTFEKSIEITKHQFGKHIWTHVQILGAEKAIALLTAGKEEIPSSLNFDTFEQYNENDYFHRDNTITTLTPVPF